MFSASVIALLLSPSPLLAYMMAPPSMQIARESGTPHLAAPRREFISSVAAVTAFLPIAGVFADEEVEDVARVSSKLGGQLDTYVDVGKSFKLSQPLGWNKFDPQPANLISGEYDVKFVDLVAPMEEVVLRTTPTKSDTSLATLGDIGPLGEKLAKGVDMEVIAKRARKTEGILFYDFEFAGKGRHLLRTLCVHRSRLWSLTVSVGDKSWGRKETVFKALQLSFVPKL
ncbi:unnamed protein product [Chrysoparadoxa australica]